ncbi:M16 family metallopeptidase [Congregibacter sp.]|uniref:M16 family metallopeptidase n=1 Tax=Congregibacter sp. TaxID=2744308 RepID=UPI003859703D
MNTLIRAGGLKAAIVILFTGITCDFVAAQDTTHPREMKLDAAVTARPSPESLQVVLENGLVAYVAEDHRAPLTTLKAYLGVGTGHGEPGDAAALAAALRRGPQSLSADKFSSTLAQMNAQYHVTQQHETTEVLLDVPESKTKQALQLLSEILTAPAFNRKSAEAELRKSSGTIDYNYSLVNAVAMFEDRLFAGHPFRRTATSEEQATATSSGARRLHEQFAVAKNITLAVAGDFKRSSVVRETNQHFKDFSAAAPPKLTEFPPVNAPAQRELLLTNAERIQGWVVIGHELPRVPKKDQAALEVMDYILGAYHLDSRLYRSSRELRGLTNDNSSFLQPGLRGPGSYSFRTYGRPEAVRLLVDVTFRELRDIRETEVTEDELFVAKGALVDGIYATRYATGVDASQSYAKEWLAEGSHELSKSYPDRVAKVTAETVQMAAQRYIHPERMLVAVLGPLKEIEAAPAIESEPQLDVWGSSP